MDFKNLNGVWKLKKICITCIELIFKFCIGEFCFQFEFFINFDLQMHKTHLKSFVFEFYLLEIRVRPFLFMMTTSEVYNVFSF